MQWDDLRFFLAVARAGSLSAAALELSVNYTTVSRRLDALQRRLGAKLLRRTPDGLALTPAGESAIALCERMEGTATELERRVAGKDRAPAGLVSVTATETFASRFIIPALGLLRVKHPEIEIELIPDHRRLDLSRRQADLAIRNLKPDDTRLVCRRIGEFDLSLYASDRYLSQHGKPRRGEGLAQHELVVWTYILPVRRSQFMGESTDGARISFRSNSTSALLRAVAEGFGIGLLPCYLADNEPGLVRLWPEVPCTKQPLWLIHHEDLRRVARIKIVADAIADAFRRQARALRG